MLDRGNKNPLEFVSQYRAVFNTPPSSLPAGDVDVSGNGRWRIWEFAGTKIDAPILGNGDMLAAFAGPPRWPQFWVTTNDFWQMESNVNYEFFHDNESAKHDPPVGLGSPRPVGRIVFDIPELAGASYEAVQDFTSAVTTATYKKEDGTVLTLRAWVAATENILVLTFESNRMIEFSASFFFPDEIGKGCDIGVDFSGIEEKEISLKGTFAGLIGGMPQQVRKTTEQGLICGYRAFCDRVDVPTKVGFAGRFLDCDGAVIKLQPGSPAVFILTLRSWAKQSRPYEMACSRARWMTKNDLDALFEQHRRWWSDFWSVSGVYFDDPVILQRYYLSQYVLASVSRDPAYPPNILGISTYDRMAWNGNYKINYNHQSAYLGLLASGHFEQSDPHDAPYLDMLDIGQEMSLRLLHHEGIYLPLGLGPVGMVSEPLLLHMKSQAVHGAINMLIRYALTLDHNYARKVYPFLRAVAVFWENDLVYENGEYRIVDDGMHERTTKEVEESGIPENATNSLGYLKVFFSMMPEISEEVGLDSEKRALWRKIAQQLSPYPIGTLNEITSEYSHRSDTDIDFKTTIPLQYHDKPIFFNEEKGAQWSIGFPANIMHIYPAGGIGLSSPPALLETARNTIEIRAIQEKGMAEYQEKQKESKNKPLKTGAWNDGNISCLFFPAAVRVGFDPEIILSELKDRIQQLGMPNGFIRYNPHGIENLSTVPNTIQEMMMLSHERIIRLFRVWPRQTYPNAQFEKLWAYGAFQVSAALSDGVVCDVQAYSHRGQTLVLENPWPNHMVTITRYPSEKQLTISGERLSIPTEIGETIQIEPIQTFHSGN